MRKDERSACYFSSSPWPRQLSFSCIHIGRCRSSIQFERRVQDVDIVIEFFCRPMIYPFRFLPQSFQTLLFSPIRSCLGTSILDGDVCLATTAPPNTTKPVRFSLRASLLDIFTASFLSFAASTQRTSCAIQVVKKGTTGSGLIVMLELFQRSLSIVACAPKGLLYMLYRVIDLFV
jgi:hypothetical protein